MGSQARAAAAQEPADADIVARVQAGDREAFGILVHRYQGRAFRLALRVLRNEELARDVVQDGFIKAYGSLDKFEGRSSFYTWLYRVVMNLCLDMKRRDKTGRQVEWTEEQSLDVAPGPSGMAAALEQTGPVAELERFEVRALMRRAIEALPEDARRTIELREIDGLSYTEIAAALGIPKGTVMSRLHYARRRLREILLEIGPELAPAHSGGKDAKEST